MKIINLRYNEINKPGTIVRMFPSAFTKVKKGRVITLSIAGEQKDIIIPDLTNLSLRNAQIKVSEIGLNIDTLMYEFNSLVQNNHIAFQIPSTGAITKAGSDISLGVSKGMPPDYFIIPDLINYSLNKAMEKIRFEGFRVGQIDYEYQPNLLNNTVIDQSFPSGLKVTISVKIDLVVSMDYHEK